MSKVEAANATNIEVDEHKEKTSFKFPLDKKWHEKSSRHLKKEFECIRTKIICHYIYSMLALKTKHSSNFHDRFVVSGLSFDIERSFRTGIMLKTETIKKICKAINDEYRSIAYSGLISFQKRGPHNCFLILQEQDPLTVFDLIRRDLIEHAMSGKMYSHLRDKKNFPTKFQIHKWFNINEVENKFNSHNEIESEIYRKADNLRIKLGAYLGKEYIAERMIGLGEAIYDARDDFYCSNYAVLLSLVVSVVENNFFLSPKSLNAIGEDAIKFCIDEYGIPPTCWNIKYSTSLLLEL